MNNNDAVLHAAAKWHARLGAPDCTGEDRVRFEDWKRENPAHERAYAAAESLSQLLRSTAVDARLHALADRAYAMGDRDVFPPPRRKRWVVPAALAAGLASAVLALRFAPKLMHGPLESAYVTADRRSDLTLDDGSVVHLDVSSSITVILSSQRREVDLLAGRAYFEVAHDAARRPFVVYAGDERITDIGTRFQVERQEQFVLVTLVDGSVSVGAERADGASQPQVLRDGEQIRIKLDDDSWVKRVVDPQLSTGWFRDRLVFRATPLAEALEEVNRYAAKKVRLGDADLADLPVSGSFIAGDSNLVTSAFSAVLPLLVVDSGEEIVLFRRKDPAQPNHRRANDEHGRQSDRINRNGTDTPASIT